MSCQRGGASSFMFRPRAPKFSYIRLRAANFAVCSFDQAARSTIERGVCMCAFQIVDSSFVGAISTNTIGVEGEKMIAIRYSVDKWQTVFNVFAKPFDDNDADSKRFTDPSSILPALAPQFDRFIFRIDLVSHRLQAGAQCEFSICCATAGAQLWDNNDGKNYLLEVIPYVDHSFHSHPSEEETEESIVIVKQPEVGVIAGGAVRRESIKEHIDRIMEQSAVATSEQDKAMEPSPAALPTNMESVPQTEGNVMESAPSGIEPAPQSEDKVMESVPSAMEPAPQTENKAIEPHLTEDKAMEPSPAALPTGMELPSIEGNVMELTHVENKVMEPAPQTEDKVMEPIPSAMEQPHVDDKVIEAAPLVEDKVMEPAPPSTEHKDTSNPDDFVFVESAPAPIDSSILETAISNIEGFMIDSAHIIEQIKDTAMEGVKEAAEFIERSVSGASENQTTNETEISTHGIEDVAHPEVEHEIKEYTENATIQLVAPSMQSTFTEAKSMPLTDGGINAPPMAKPDEEKCNELKTQLADIFREIKEMQENAERVDQPMVDTVQHVTINESMIQLPEAVQGAIDSVSENVHAGVESVNENVLKPAIETMHDLGEVIGSVPEKVQDTIESMKETVASVPEKVGDTIESMQQHQTPVDQQVVLEGRIEPPPVPEAGTQVVIEPPPAEAAKGMLESMQDTMASMVPDSVHGVLDSIQDSVASVPGHLQGAIESMQEGIASMPEKVQTALDAVASMPGKVHDALIDSTEPTSIVEPTGPTTTVEDPTVSPIDVSVNINETNVQCSAAAPTIRVDEQAEPIVSSPIEKVSKPDNGAPQRRGSGGGGKSSSKSKSKK